MISYSGYDDVIQRVYDSGNGHVFAYWDSLNENEKKSLLDELKGVDFSQLEALFKEKEAAAAEGYGPAPCITLPENEDEKDRFKEAAKAGIGHIKQGKVAAFIVAGGQGSRLGFDGPKGKFPVGPVSGKTLFQIHGEKIKKYSDKYGVAIPWLVMTSRANHDETVAYFKEQNFFGLGEGNVYIFPQNMIPSLDSEGKLILQDKCTLFMNPDGHGGSLTALASSGTLKKLLDRGIETISYFQVDNPLVKIVDPEFIGFHMKNSADISSKMVRKAYPEEKVGVFVKYNDGKFGVIEYSDLPEEKIQSKDNNGELEFGAGSIAIHLFGAKFVHSITSGGSLSLPYHVAKKNIKAYIDGGVQEIPGFKYEKFVFDALSLTDKNIILETKREEEFAPVKNPEGVDSAQSARDLMTGLFKSWFEEKGISVPEKCRVLEIAPSVAVEADDLPGGLSLPNEEEILVD